MENCNTSHVFSGFGALMVTVSVTTQDIAVSKAMKLSNTLGVNGCYKACPSLLALRRSLGLDLRMVDTAVYVHNYPATTHFNSSVAHLNTLFIWVWRDELPFEMIVPYNFEFDQTPLIEQQRPLEYPYTVTNVAAQSERNTMRTILRTW